MSAIDNPQAVRFVNERGRVCADALVSAYHTAKETLVGWDAWGMASLIPPTENNVNDGADVDAAVCPSTASDRAFRAR